jgi:hypothetical protein
MSEKVNGSEPEPIPTIEIAWDEANHTPRYVVKNFKTLEFARAVLLQVEDHLKFEIGKNRMASMQQKALEAAQAEAVRRNLHLGK